MVAFGYQNQGLVDKLVKNATSFSMALARWLCRTSRRFRYPTASNLDEFKALEEVADLVWATSPDELDGAELVVLPGSKHVAGDLAWLWERGFAPAVARARAVLGICGGLQMLGTRIDDPVGVDGSADGLGLLQVRTVFGREKRTTRVETAFARVGRPWDGLSQRAFAGYEIRHGETTAVGDVAHALPDGLGFVSGRFLGIALHGLFEQPELVRAVLGAAPRSSLEDAFDVLADAVEERLDVDMLRALAGVA